MKLASLRRRPADLNPMIFERPGAAIDPRDGALVVVSRDLKRAVLAGSIAPSLRVAVENWAELAPKLASLGARLEAGSLSAADGVFGVQWGDFHSPLPRAFQWADGSAFLHHVRLVRKARKAEMPESLLSVPLMYQGGSDDFLAPTAGIPQIDFSHGTDFEGEIAVVVDETPMGVSPAAALERIRLLLVVNDVSLRGLIPEELAAGFGFFQSKPSSAFGPVAVTPDELGTSWREGRLHLPLHVEFNGEFFGRANAGEMHFHFGQLIAHAARTRNLRAGTIIGSGTVSNDKPGVGSSCLVERRMIETIEKGSASTPFMKVGDRVRIEVFSDEAKTQSVFGPIDQTVISVSR
jgi:fumarylacetoacetate (FAA) hydrolase